MENIALLKNRIVGLNWNITVPLLVILIIGMMILPIPVFLLDILFSFNISISLIVLLCCIYAKRALEFTVFPAVLLITTLLRLSLNVASTRVVLINGHNGPDAAGEVIKSFGEVVIGNSYTVGIIIFMILTIINFVVITKGGSRISEVSARFTLDAMPGKQMAVDADLNAGVITQEEAKTRRQEIMQESDFYGAMDGASKFVRGDAIAGLMILFINIIGGIIIGITEYSMSFSIATKNYTLLAIGDGLVAQVPSLLLSIAAAIIVSRVNNSQDLSIQTSEQLLKKPQALAMTAGVLAILGMIPGMPHFSFLSLAVVLVIGSVYVDRKNKQSKKILPKSNETVTPENTELDWEDVKSVDVLGLELGFRLIDLVDKSKEELLIKRIKGIRKKISQELGFLIPTIHIKDNLDIKPNTYKLILMGVETGEAEVYPDKFLAINPGTVYGTLEGVACKDPTFGLDAIWITPNQKDYAQSLGYTAVDASTVIATHISHIIHTHSAELIGHEEVQQLLDKLGQVYPKLVETLIPGCLSLNCVVKVLQKLLEEKIPIIDMRSIVESLIESSTKSQNPDILTAQVRVSLKRLIFQTIAGNQPCMPVSTLEPRLEQILLQSLQITQEAGGGIEPTLTDKLIRWLTEYENQQAMKDEVAILIVAPPIRQHISRLFRFSVPNLYVLSYQEIPDNKQVEIIKCIGQD